MDRVYIESQAENIIRNTKKLSANMPSESANLDYCNHIEDLAKTILVECAKRHATPT